MQTFMEILFYVVIAAVPTAPPLVGYIHYRCQGDRRSLEDFVFPCIFTLLAFVVPIVFLGMPAIKIYNDYVSNTAIVRKQEPIVAHYERYCTELEQKINDSKVDQKMFTVNSDTPVKSLVEAHLQASNQLLDARKAIDEAKIKIEGVKIGLFAFVTKWVHGEKAEE